MHFHGNVKGFSKRVVKYVPNTFESFETFLLKGEFMILFNEG